MLIPDDLSYTAQHEWVRLANGVARIGITDYAQDALGDVVFVGVPDVGRVVRAEESFTEVESTKSVSDIYAPVGGTISAVNEMLRDRPEMLNQDPYGEGWLCEITIAGDVPTLLSAGEYRSLVGEA